MKTKYQFFIILALPFLIFLSNISAQKSTNTNLPEDAKLRIGKGTLGEIAYFPDGTRFAVATSIGIWVYDSTTGKELYQLTDYTNGIDVIRFSADGKTLATENPDGSIQLWDTSTSNRIHVLSDNDFDLFDPVFSPNGKIIAVQCAERFTYFRKTLRLYDVKTGKHINTISEPTNLFYNFRFSPDNKTLLTWQYGKIKLWDVATAKQLKTINDPSEEYHDNGINDIQFSPDGKTIYVLCSIRITRNSRERSWVGDVGIIFYREIHAEEWKLLEKNQQEVDDNGFSSIYFSPDGKQIIVEGTTENMTYLWSPNTGQQLNSEKQPNDLIENKQNSNQNVSFSKNGIVIATGGVDGTIHLYSTNTGLELKKLIGHEGIVDTVLFSPDGITLLSKDSDRTVRLWNALSGKLIKTLEGYNEGIYDITITPNGKTIASWSSDSILRLYDISTGKLNKQYNLNEQHRLNGINGDVTAIYFSPNANTFLSRSIWSHLCLWDVNTGELINRLSERDNYIKQVDISPNGKTIAFRGGDDNNIFIWDANTGKRLNTISDIKGELYQIKYSTDSSFIVSNSSETTQIWDTNTGKLFRTINGISGWIDSAYFSKNASTILTSIYFESEDDGTFLWDGITGEHITDLNYSGAIGSVNYSPDGKIIAIENVHVSVVSLFDISKRQHVGDLDGHVSLAFCGGGTISDVRFSHNGQTIATASNVDATAIIWNSNTGKRLKTLTGHTRGVNAVAFSPDGKTLASGSSDGTILLWDIE